MLNENNRYFIPDRYNCINNLDINYNLNYNFNPTQQHQRQSQNFIEPQRIQQIQNVFEIVKAEISNFLDRLDLLYKRFFIRFPLNQYENVLLRMLSPIQLNSFLPHNQIGDILIKKTPINFNCQSHLPTNHPQLQFQYQPLTQPKIHKINAQKQNQNFKRIKQKKYSQPPVQNKAAFPLNKIQKITCQQSLIRNKLKFQNERSRGFENEICFWIMSEIQRGKLVTKAAICEKARQFDQKNQFKACPRWCTNFLNRNPQVKRMVYQRMAQFGKLKKKIIRKLCAQIKKANNYTDEQNEQQNKDILKSQNIQNQQNKQQNFSDVMGKNNQNKDDEQFYQYEQDDDQQDNEISNIYDDESVIQIQ